MTEKVFTDLTAEQADGLACVWCGADDADEQVPVGFAETGSQVFACAGSCHGHVQAFRIFEEKGELASLTELRQALEAERAARRKQQP